MQGSRRTVLATLIIAAGAFLFGAYQVRGAQTTWLTITNPSPASGERFGSAVAAVGRDAILITAPFDNTGTNSAGVACLYGTNGALVTTITNPTPAIQDIFGASAAAVGDTHVLLGSYPDSTGAQHAGAAYLFDLRGSLITTFTNPAPVADDWFGRALAAVGSDKVIIGAPFKHVPVRVGAAYLFDLNGRLLTAFANPNPSSSEQFGDEFGISVAGIGTDKVIIGAHNESRGARASGAAYIFSEDGTLLTTITNPGPIISDFERFGISVAAVGNDKVLIGAYGAAIGSNYGGAAYLFDLEGRLLARFRNPTPEYADDFGLSVAALGTDKVVIGDPFDDTGAIDAGAVYVFSLDGTLMMAITNPSPAASDIFGISIAALGLNKIIVGANQDDTGARNSGVAYVFTILSPPLLHITQTNGVITVSWKDSAGAYLLEQAEHINGPLSWLSVSPPYQTNLTQISYSTPAILSARFYRLRGLKVE